MKNKNTPADKNVKLVKTASPREGFHMMPDSCGNRTQHLRLERAPSLPIRLRSHGVPGGI